MLAEVFTDPPELLGFETELFCLYADPRSQVAGMHEFCQLLLAMVSDIFSEVIASAILFCTLYKDSSKRSAKEIVKDLVQQLCNKWS